MPAVADTSFIFALYGRDGHTATAKACAMHLGRSIALTTLQRYEFTNAVRFAAFRKVITSADVLAFLTAFEADVQAGFIVIVPCDLEALVDEAQRISARHTLTGGNRSFDVLHVAAARVLGASEFLTFDASQRKLAKALGFTVKP